MRESRWEDSQGSQDSEPPNSAILAVFYRHYLKLWYSINVLHYGSGFFHGRSSLTIHLLGQGNSDHSNTGGGGC